MLHCKNLSFTYEDDDSTEIVRNLDFKVEKGEFVCLLGKSGCGKSTIFRLALGFEKANYGEIITENKIGFMPQKDLLLPWRTVEKNLALPLEIAKRPKEEISKKVSDMLEVLKLEEWAKAYPSSLSGGMRQRVSFARVVLTGASTLLLDEPFSALDYFTRLELADWLQKQQIKLKKTILFISHNIDEALLLSNRILVFTEKPVTRLESIEVNASFPRSSDILHKKEIVKIKEYILEVLKN